MLSRLFDVQKLTGIQVVEAMLNGRHSCFDGLAPLMPKLEDDCQFDTAAAAIQYLFAAIPRLARLVRRARDCPEDEINADKANALAKPLYFSEVAQAVPRMLAEGTETVPTTSPIVDASLIPASFHYKTLPMFGPATQYFTLRVILCSLIQTLLHAGVADECFDLLTVQREDLFAAYSINMSLQYALLTDPSRGLLVLKMLIPTQMSLGAWYRLEERFTANRKDENHQRAVRMKDWTLSAEIYIEKMWNSRINNHVRMEQICKMYAGGPLEAWMGMARPAL